MAYIFQTRTNEIKLLTEYESVIQKVLLFLDSILLNTFIFRKQFYIFVSDLKIIGHWNPQQ
jgi:hypothetical protein